MTVLRGVFSAAVLSFATAWGGLALADVPPANACQGAAGTACNTAGPNADQPGVCTSAMCPHTGPGPDGGLTTTEHPCVLCQEATSTSAATSGGTSTTAGATSGGTSTTGTAPSGGGSSCAVGAVGRDGMIRDGLITGALLLAGLGALYATRRRRHG